MTKFLIGGAAAIAIAAAAGSAQPAPPPPGVAQGTAPAPMTPPPPPGDRQVRVRFMSDHVMTRDDVAKHVAELFAKLDANHDGFVTKTEVDGFHADIEAKVHAAMARAGDAQRQVGDIEKRLAQRGVFIGDRGAMFDRLDKNHDGNISRQEFMADGPSMREERVMVLRGPGGAPGMPPMPNMPDMHGMHMHGMGMGMGMGHFGDELFEMADANHDGRVSLAEAQAAALAHFEKADLNHDGRITPDEHQQMHETIRIEHRPS